MDPNGVPGAPNGLPWVAFGPSRGSPGEPLGGAGGALGGHGVDFWAFLEPKAEPKHCHFGAFL